MSTDSDSAKVLIEIRDLLQSREAKYDEYLKSADARYAKQLGAARAQGWSSLVYLAFAVAVGVFLGGLMLRGLGWK